MLSVQRPALARQKAISDFAMTAALLSHQLHVHDVFLVVRASYTVTWCAGQPIAVASLGVCVCVIECKTKRPHTQSHMAYNGAPAKHTLYTCSQTVTNGNMDTDSA